MLKVTDSCIYLISDKDLIWFNNLYKILHSNLIANKKPKMVWLLFTKRITFAISINILRSNSIIILDFNFISNKIIFLIATFKWIN